MNAPKSVGATQMQTPKSKLNRDVQALAFITSMYESGWRSLNSWGDGGHTFTMLSKNGRCVIVQIYPRGNGFEVWKPITHNTKIDATLAAVEAYGQPNDAIAEAEASR